MGCAKARDSNVDMIGTVGITRDSNVAMIQPLGSPRDSNKEMIGTIGIPRGLGTNLAPVNAFSTICLRSPKKKQNIPSDHFPS